MKYGIQYLQVMLWGLLPFALTNAYASTLRETGETTVPMVGGIVAVFINLILNYILIFGHFGAPALGVEGAALATVISRFVELAIVAGWTHLNPEKKPFIKDVFRSFFIPGKLFRDIMVSGFPLLINEFFWASGMAILNQCYSTCGLDVVPAMNISSTLYNLGSVVYLALGNCVGIIMGQMLGAGKEEAEIRDANRKLITAAVLGGTGFGMLMMAFSVVFPLLYNTTPEIRSLAAALICINGIFMAANSYTNAAYFTVRSGGQTAVVFLFDSCFVCGFCVPLAYVLSRFTDMAIIPLYTICHGTDVIKCLIGGYMIRQGKWIKNLTK
jgi:putative MATE family efflux protein